MTKKFRTASILLLASFAVGCGGGDSPAPENKGSESAAAPKVDDDPVGPPAASAAESGSTKIEGGPGTGSEFALPPDLGSTPANTDASAPAEPEFSLPPQTTVPE